MIRFVKSFLLFFILFDLSFTAFPSLSTGKIFILLLTMLMLIKRKYKKQINKKEFLIILSYFIVLIHVFFIYMINSNPETTTIARIVYYLINSVYVSFLFTNLFDNKNDFLRTLSMVTFIQSCFVIISWFSVEYRILINQILVQGGNISLLSAKRPPGLMNSAGAKASVVLGIGTAVCLYLISLTKNKVEIMKYTIMMTIGFIATFIIGRTGLVIFLFLSSAILFQKFKNILFNRKVFFLLGSAILLIVISIPFIPEEMYQTIDQKVTWVDAEFSDGLLQSQTVNALKNMSIKDLNYDTLIGTSRIRLPDGQHDSGYIQNYHSMGLIISFFFYSLVLYHIMFLLINDKNSSFHRKTYWFLYALVIGLFIAEVKEPFVLSYVYPMIIFTILRLPENDECIEDM